MHLFKRSTSKLQIPPVQSAGQGDAFSDHSAFGSSIVRDKYSRSNVYAGGEVNLDHDRNELFSGYSSTKPDGRSVAGPSTLDDEEDVEAIKQKTRFKKQESVNSTQNSIRLAQAAVETGTNTLRRLGEQSGMNKCGVCPAGANLKHHF
jgi:hypothetical protein